jgi:hypothetical protein
LFISVKSGTNIFVGKRPTLEDPYRLASRRNMRAQAGLPEKKTGSADSENQRPQGFEHRFTAMQEGLSGGAVRREGKGCEIVVEGDVLLEDDNDVLDRRYRLGGRAKPGKVNPVVTIVAAASVPSRCSQARWLSVFRRATLSETLRSFAVVGPARTMFVAHRVARDFFMATISSG